MDDKSLGLELLEKGFELAYYTYPNRQIAIQIVLSARDEFNTAAFKQGKRVNKQIRSWFSRNDDKKAYRAKVYLNPEQLFQQLVLVSSDNYLREREKHKIVSQED